MVDNIIKEAVCNFGVVVVDLSNIDFDTINILEPYSVIIVGSNIDDDFDMF